MAICLTGMLTCIPASAAPLPLWEAGIGLAVLRLADYRGSDEASTYVLPAPYFVYRGEVLKADRNGLRGMLFDNEQVEVSFSVNGTLPVNSKNNAARRGMGNLKPTIETGANASITLWRSEDANSKLDLRLPLRTAVTMSSSPKQIGWVFSPNLNVDVKDPAGFTGWNLGMLAGPLFSSRDYNAYFYSVNAADATATRPAYAASGGYAGSQFTLALSKRFASQWIGGFVRYDTLAGAVFADSPLVRQQHTVSAGIAMTWVFGKSAKLVEMEE